MHGNFHKKNVTNIYTTYLFEQIFIYVNFIVYTALLIINKNDNIHKNKVQDIRGSDEY